MARDRGSLSSAWRARATQDARRTFPARGEGAAPHASLTQSFGASLQLCRAAGRSNTALRSEAGSGPADSNSPSLGTPCCKLSLSDLSHNRHCPWGSPDREHSRPRPDLLVCRAPRRRWGTRRQRLLLQLENIQVPSPSLSVTSWAAVSSEGFLHLLWPTPGASGRHLPPFPTL